MITLKKVIRPFLLFIFLLFITNRLLFFRQGFLEKAASLVVYPILWSTNKIATYLSDLSAHKKTYQELSNEYEILKQKYDKLFEEMVIIKASTAYDKNTQEIIDFQKRYNLSTALFAKILVKNFSPEEHSLFINRGARDQVQPGMVAIYKLQILGKVVEVFECYSKILLITDQKCKIAAITNTTQATGILTGINDLKKCNLTYVSHLATVVNDDLIFSSGQGLVFPEGFCLGKVVHHELKEKKLYHEVQIEPLVDLASISFCLLTDQSKINLF